MNGFKALLAIDKPGEIHLVTSGEKISK